MQFVILHHRGIATPHFDLMLQTPSGQLLTWQMEKPGKPGSYIARKLPDHRSVYLQYQGSIPGNRGWVKTWESGTFRPLMSTGTQVRVILQGKLRLSGILELSYIADKDWEYRFQKISRGL